MTADILRITDPIITDESIVEYEHIEYNPIAGTNLNDGGDITIAIELQDLFTHPSESFLLIEGRLTNNDNANTPDADADVVTLINNGIMYLFKRIRYDLAEKEIETIQHPGQTTTMLGLLKYPDDFSKSVGLNQLWYKDASPDAALIDVNTGFMVRHYYVINNPEDKGTFSFRIPLKHIFGFCEDYTKIIYGMKQTLTLTRDNDNNTIFRANGVAAGKITLNKVSWYMPKVIPEDVEKAKIYKIIEKKEKIPVAYRMIQCATAQITQTPFFNWRLSAKTAPEVPRFIIIGFQSDKNNNQEQNPAVFNHLRVKSIHCTLNTVRYPKTDYKISFPNLQFMRVYGDAASFKTKFFNMNQLISSPNFTPVEYRDLYPLFVFDVSKQSEKLKYSTTDIQINIDFEVNPPVNTVGYAVLLSDRLAHFQSDGQKFTFDY